LNAELRVFTDTEALTAWAGKILPQKNQLTTSDAEAVEIAFVAKLTELGVATENIAFEISNAATAGSGSPEIRHRSAWPAVGQDLSPPQGRHGFPSAECGIAPALRHPAPRNGGPSAAFTVPAAIKIG
jgi:hypothetical protein